jgi:pyruvate dehydrogenase E2 component (dihydrolipoamide acetyltransferase)
VLILHKDLNAHFLEDTLRRFSSVHMGVAVDTDRGLMVPTLLNSSKKSLNEISIETKELSQECRKGMINPDKLKGGTFTITNLGALGIESFTPVINPPQTAILGVNTIETKIRENNGAISAYSSINLSLTFDHRAVDGAPAARFLKDLKEYLENFTIHLAFDGR